MPQIVDRGQLPLQMLGAQPLASPAMSPQLTREGNIGDFFGDVFDKGLLKAIGGAIRQDRRLTKEGQQYLGEAPIREAKADDRKRANEQIEFEEEQAGRKTSQARQGLGMFRDVMGLQNDLADQAMQTQRFTWEQEDRNAQSAEARQKLDAAKALRSQHDAANMAQVNAYAQAIQKVGKPYSPDTLSAASAMAKVLEPREFQIWAKDLFETEAGGGDATDLKAKALKGFADFTKAQRDAEIAELSLELERANLELKDAGEKNTGSEFDKAKLRSAAQIRQHLEDKKMLAILKKSAAWNPDFGSRSMTQYNQMFAGEDVSAWIETKYDAIAERDFILRYKRPPQTPEENAMVSELARQLSAEGGWEP